MAETELAPCALCLQVFESPSMIEVQLPPGKGEPGPRRRLCSGCVSAIEAALPEGKRWESKAPKQSDKEAPDAKAASRGRDGRRRAASSGEPKSEKISEKSEEVAKDA